MENIVMGNTSLYEKENNLNIINSIKKSILSPAVQRKLLIKAQRGDIEAKNTLLESNIPFVIKIAKQLSYADVNFDELVSEGCLGLDKAISKFDLNKQNSFISYSVYWIKFYMLRLINDNSFIRKPFNKVRELSNVNKIKNEIQNNQESTSMNSQEEETYIARKLNMSTKKMKQIHALQPLQQKMVSLDAEIANCNNSSFKMNTVGDIIADSNAACPETYALDKNIKSILDECLSTFTKRDSNIIKDRFSMKDGKAITLSELSKKYQLSKERVRQIEIRIIKKLRNMFSKIGLLNA